MKRLLALVCLLISAPTAMADDSDLDAVLGWMSGSFSSAGQAAEDSAYYHITLEMVPIWPEQQGGHWLYVEQAVAATKSEPYRQRIYRVSKTPDGVIESVVYLLPEPGDVIGAWKDKSLLDGLSPDELEIREGCTVFLQRQENNRFEGSTRADECKSSLRGATYATSEVIVTSAGIKSWDRGFDADGKQVWGAEKGAYIFMRE